MGTTGYRKRLHAVAATVVAAATMLAMGVAGVGSANAATPRDVATVNANKGTITVSGFTTGHTLKAVKLASYDHAFDDGESTTVLTSISVQTVATLKSQIIAAATKANGAAPSGTDYDADNPMQWVVKTFVSDTANYTTTDKALRDFVTALAKGDSTTTPAVPGLDFSSTTLPTSTDGTFNNLPIGIYIIKDVTTGNEGATSNAIPMMVGTTIGTYTKLVDKDLGQVSMKNQTPTLTKKATKLNDTALAASGWEDDLATKKAKIGDTVEFELTGKVPSLTGFSAFDYTIKDTPTAGLVYVANSAKVTVDGTDKTDDATITPPTSAGNPLKVTIPYDKLQTYTVGKAIVVTYKVKLTKLASGNWKKQNNGAELTYSNDSSDATSKGKVEAAGTKLALYSVKLTTVDGKQDTVKLGGAKYNIYASADLNTKLKFTGTRGSYIYDQNGTVAELESATDGTLSVDGLPADTYTFDQSAIDSGYIKTKFTVTANKNIDGTAEGGADTHTYFNNTADTWGLIAAGAVEQENVVTPTISNPNPYNGILTVKNVNSIVALPLTGGAGIILLATLIVLSGAIAGGTAVVRRRTAKRR